MDDTFLFTTTPGHVSSSYYATLFASRPSQLVSDRTLAMTMKVLYFLIHSFIILGLFSNVINMIVFRRLGFVAVSNISLFVLSLVDLVVLFFIATIAIFRSPFFSVAYFASGYDLSLLITPMFFSMMAISSWVTAVINMERCCCIMFPLKVKLIFTRRTLIGLLVGMAVYQICIVIPHYLHIGLTTITSPITNLTIYIFDFVRYDERLGITSLFLSFSVPTFVCFVLVLTGTIFLVVRLRESAEFHKSMAVMKSERNATRERVVARSVIGVCVIYIACMGPNVIAFLVSIVFPPFHFSDPEYGNVVWMTMTLTTLLQTISASVNVFVYVRMMTQYRQMFNKLFRIRPWPLKPKILESLDGKLTDVS